MPLPDHLTPAELARLNRRAGLPNWAAQLIRRLVMNLDQRYYDLGDLKAQLATSATGHDSPNTTTRADNGDQHFVPGANATVSHQLGDGTAMHLEMRPDGIEVNAERGGLAVIPVVGNQILVVARDPH